MCTAALLSKALGRLRPRSRSSVALVLGSSSPRTLQFSAALALAATLVLASDQFLRSATPVVGHFGPPSPCLVTSALGRVGAWPLLRLRRSVTPAIGRLRPQPPQCSAFFSNQPRSHSVATTLAPSYVHRIRPCVHSFIDSFIHSFTHSIVHSFIQAPLVQVSSSALRSAALALFGGSAFPPLGRFVACLFTSLLASLFVCCCRLRHCPQGCARPFLRLTGVLCAQCALRLVGRSAD